MHKYSHKTVSIPRSHPFYCMTSTGRVGEHRLIMAEHLGRPLVHGEVVHHKDNNPRNNNLDNLLITNYRDHIIITRRDALKRNIRSLRWHIKRMEKELIDIEKLHEELFSNV